MPRRASNNWAHLIQDWKKSGLSKAAFCRERGLSKDSFYKWIRTFEKQSGSTAKVTPVNFLEIEASPADRKDPLHMRCLRIITSYGTILEIPL
ncbi:MAG: IS66 family insertion sequence element accessory protein TnpA [Oligoflexus sp.]|jgi:hypothetical protein